MHWGPPRGGETSVIALGTTPGALAVTAAAAAAATANPTEPHKRCIYTYIADLVAAALPQQQRQQPAARLSRRRMAQAGHV